MNGKKVIVFFKTVRNAVITVLNQAWLLYVAALVSLFFTSSIVFADEVKSFVSGKPWQVTIDIDEFEPWDLLGAKTILGGRVKDGMTITILTEITKPGTTASEIRELYGQRSLEGFGQKETAERLDEDDISVLLFKLAKQNILDSYESEKKRMKQKMFKEYYKNRWSYHGYAVKDDVAFDIHLSTDMDKHTKEQILAMIKSFKIKPSTELEELAQLYEELYKEFDKDLDGNIQVKERLRLSFDFIKKFPTNPELHVFIGDHYLRSNELKQAISYYLKALENHKIQPFINPVTLWTCYDGLGLCYGMSGEYEPSKQYFEKGYELAKDISEPYYIASSAYNLACLYAETNDMKNIFTYLAEAIQLNPESKEQAKQDPSFKNIKDNRQFKELLDGPPRTSTIFQKDADIVRLRHLKYYGELLERYHRITGKYPFQGQKDVPIYVHVANAEQIEFTKQGPSYPRVVIPFKEFVKEIELVLGKEINEYYDPQYRPDYKPNFYIYMVDHDTYFFAVHVHQPYPFARKVDEHYYKIELSNHPNPQNQAVSLEQLLNSSEFQAELNRTVSKEGFFKEREDKFLHHTKPTH